MFKLFKKAEKKFDRVTLRKNDISILILDERWNHMFENMEKPPEIIRSEEKLRELLKLESRLTAETKTITSQKKACMDKIISLTTEAYENGNEAAKDEMKACEQEVIRINDRLKQIETEIEEIPFLIKEANLELLENAVNQVYIKIRGNLVRAQELEKLIEETREKLKSYIDEKEGLSQEGNEIYTYFHDLLGGEELEKLDRQFFSE